VTYLRIAIDDIEVATVETDGRDVVAIHVGGTRADEDYADLGVTGGIYDREGVTDHRIWIHQMSLRIGQAVGVAFVERGLQSGDGSSLSDLYPDSVDRDTARIDPVELAKEERQAARVRDRYGLRLTVASGVAVTLVTSPDDHGFGFHVLWSKWNSDRVSVSLHTYTIDSVANGEPGRYAVCEKMSVGEGVRLELVG
jgi:hypothetical protein